MFVVGWMELVEPMQVELAVVQRSGVTRGVKQSRDREQSLEVKVRAASFVRGVGVKERNASGAQLCEMCDRAACLCTQKGRCACGCVCPTAGQSLLNG